MPGRGEHQALTRARVVFADGEWRIDSITLSIPFYPVPRDNGQLFKGLCLKCEWRMREEHGPVDLWSIKPFPAECWISNLSLNISN